jgi:hypothetical protein
MSRGNSFESEKSENSNSLEWEDNCCPRCGNDEQSLIGCKYGEKEFTGFIRKNGQIYWIGKNEKYKKKINLNNPKDKQFFNTIMKHYDR